MRKTDFNLSSPYPSQEYWWEHNPRIRRAEENWEARNMSTIDFRAELEKLVNKHSMENGSNTPDFILAEYLTGCLEAFDNAVKRRTQWYGTTRAEWPGLDPVVGDAPLNDPPAPAAPTARELRAAKFAEQIGRSTGVINVATVLKFLNETD